MRFDREKADIRFGCGLSPRIAPPRDIQQMIDQLKGPDEASDVFPIPKTETILELARASRAARQQRRKATTEKSRENARDARRSVRRRVQRLALDSLANGFLRRALTVDGLRERLCAFWGDHFTASGKGVLWRHARPAYVETAIRPHVTGNFADMLRAVAMQPLMLHYLDQHLSVGPTSRVAQVNRTLDGLNENLAREMLELHTLGVDGPYDQSDVRQLARLLTGLSYNLKQGFIYRSSFAEPGPETILGVTYGQGKGRLEDIHAALDDIATHPSTAAHVARKLAVHFVSDEPAEALVAHIAARFRDTDGDMAAVTEALLEHPAAWQPAAENVKRPVDFIGSALRALDIVPRHIPKNDPRKMLDLLIMPLALMGQDWTGPSSPEGWPEANEEWITPQRLAARLQWAMSAPFALRRVLPNPEDFALGALGHAPPQDVIRAARAAETRAEGVGIVLASPAFQRM
ncbi:DUF1800 domain-containing protein [Roseovarius sp. TE539]|uniref:DUF1800 domain-containing protein n=1 Tax=Roseovarius sp. TE539 TaxID=2249812 RepID=UPI000DDECDD8|nr:DUF1800 domain-containing protein [Roseovarius sp. TE539]RBI75750.1 DUF1800 domain-containing protein [Roseovarius sp. TE539]